MKTTVRWQRLGRAALTLGSGYQANRDALEQVLRVLAAQKGTRR